MRSSRRNTPVLNSPVIRAPHTGLYRRRARSKSASTVHPLVLQGSRTVIVLLVLWFEYGTFYSHVHWHCSFDDRPTTKDQVWDPSIGLIGGWRSSDAFGGTKPFHALIVSDPQILDMRSYPGRPWIARWLGIKVTEQYARKSWSFVRRSRGQTGGVQGVVWLGDLLDSGVDTVDTKE